MNQTEIELVQRSFALVAPQADVAAAMFYTRLFEVAPEVRPLFPEDLTKQGSKLMATLGVVVNGLRDLDRIVPIAQELARQHVGYGVTVAHYTPVGAALIDTLKTALGKDFDAETEAAWAAAYDTLAGVMIAAAYDSAD